MLMMLLYMLYPEFSILNPCYTRVEYWIKACFFLAVVIMQRTQGRFAEKYDSNQIEITHTAEATKNTKRRILLSIGYFSF